ncbi:MAG: LysM peptidoglycan-binding domain-containing protein [Chloroflexi bacterium]|nr:LysM peptidoglycan-binding domain-containing protein [Chloroflexota bacterium]
MRVLRLGMAAVLCLIVGLTGVQAQDNLLNNPSMEEGSFGAYIQKRGGEKAIYMPNGGWDYWLPSTPRGDFYDRSDRVTINPHPESGYPRPLEGIRALSVDCGFVSCTSAIFQTVSTGITPGTNVRAFAWGQVKTCNLERKNGQPSGNCSSSVESGARTRVGIDPDGGTDPNAPEIVWAAFISPHEQGGWQQMIVDATATGSAVTFFMYSTQTNFSDINITYWDAASLTVGGGGGAAPSAATPTPTPPPVVAFVVPQAAQDDGSIVHVVQAGDTVDSIAFAYGVTRTQILELNNLASPRYITPGQKLVIKTPEPGAGSGADAAGTPEAVPPTQDSAVVDQAAPPTAEQPPAQEQPPATEEQPPAPPTTAPEPTQPPAPAPVTEVASNIVNPAATSGSVCVFIFDDRNQNRIQESGENLLPGGGIVLNQGAAAVGSHQTDGISEPYCFSDLAAGDYVAAATAPDGYGLTTSNQFRLQLGPGARVNLAFGAAQGVQPAAPPPADAGGLVDETAPKEPAAQSLTDQLLSISGYIVLGLAGIVLLGGLGIAFALRRR